MKPKELYRSKLHGTSSSHDVTVVRFQSPEREYTLKMTYKSYNAAEHFTGEVFTQGEWKHTFSIHDLGVLPNSRSYVQNESKRLTNANELIAKGIEFFNKLIK